MTISLENDVLLAIMRTGHIRVTFQCPECDGRGYIEHPRSYCLECGHDYASDEEQRKLGEVGAANGYNYLTCGHSWEHLESDASCNECECSGEQVRDLSMKELAAVLRLA